MAQLVISNRSKKKSFTLTPVPMDLHTLRIFSCRITLRVSWSLQMNTKMSTVAGGRLSATNMIVTLDGGGKVAMSGPQQNWTGDSVMQTAVFAGQQLRAISDSSIYFDLHYLGFKTCGFKSMAEAKNAAPAFAKTVLAHMSGLIR
ncbi:MAG: hypothetical protein ACTS9Y_00485 [Methylophilus sp.]|uniref:hypothetical protein n=1 Tax=Methylophilus sp. TaxID=29541 RepID=UPI003FA0ECAE